MCEAHNKEISSPLKSSEISKGLKHSWRPPKTRCLYDYVVSQNTSGSNRVQCAHPKPAKGSDAESVKKPEKQSPHVESNKKITTVKKAILAEKLARAKKNDPESGMIKSECSFRHGAAVQSTSKLDNLALKFVQRIKEFQDRSLKENPVKARSKRRIVSGIREVRKHLLLGRAQFVLVARDLEYVDENDVLAVQVAEIKELGAAGGVFVLEACKKHELGRTLSMRPFVSAVAVLDLSGGEDLYREVINESSRCLTELRKADHADQSSLFP